MFCMALLRLIEAMQEVPASFLGPVRGFIV
jgi:hypothetical protein